MENFDIKKYLKEHNLGPYGMLGGYVDLQPINEAEAGGKLRLDTKKTAAEINALLNKKELKLVGSITKQSKGVRGEHDLIVTDDKNEKNKEALRAIGIKFEKFRAYGETN